MFEAHFSFLTQITVADIEFFNKDPILKIKYPPKFTVDVKSSEEGLAYFTFIGATEELTYDLPFQP